MFSLQIEFGIKIKIAVSSFHLLMLFCSFYSAPLILASFHLLMLFCSFYSAPLILASFHLLMLFCSFYSAPLILASFHLYFFASQLCRSVKRRKAVKKGSERIAIKIAKKTKRINIISTKSCR
uniref:Uncharacterized protein n=1 Tax=Hydrodictyon reticulatum TaxID=3107 RepID=A0A1W5RN64_HYDRE|nr:hypothetical protein [Hydrodictyon reticulatum]AQU64582.1 hypothetical protein [Hydrodictyon reticulatum]